MAAKLTRLIHWIAIQLHAVAESCTICSSSSRRSVRKLLDIPSYVNVSCQKMLFKFSLDWRTFQRFISWGYISSNTGGINRRFGGTYVRILQGVY